MSCKCSGYVHDKSLDIERSAHYIKMQIMQVSYTILLTHIGQSQIFGLPGIAERLGGY
jgi:hypothetical protein